MAELTTIDGLPASVTAVCARATSAEDPSKAITHTKVLKTRKMRASKTVPRKAAGRRAGARFTPVIIGGILPEL